MRILRFLCNEFGVSIEPDAFLGSGATSMVFRVKKGEDVRALKLTVGFENVKRIASDFYTLDRITTQGVPCVVHHASDFMYYPDSPDLQGGGFLLKEVGIPFDKEKNGLEDVVSIMVALRALHNYGYKHGDARLANVVYIQNFGWKWIDVGGSSIPYQEWRTFLGSASKYIPDYSRRYEFLMEYLGKLDDGIVDLSNFENDLRNLMSQSVSQLAASRV